ncbi:AAA family ATPase [Prauserella sp. PE36]|uniref:AAA family ATPase n=1 Tax=Prauserella sp. PE36 TaxID=1504709 RepID=UPI001313F950|nr:AAA family ATPase [Prauserella sp. PE36]
MTDTGNSGEAGHLVQEISARVEAAPSLTDEAKLCVLAALDGDAELAEALEGRYSPPERQVSTEADDRAPVGAFISSIQARGFRGIGAESRLELHPAPGLTVVAGRNGSGKSSFSEALEVALTGSTYRWRKKATAWSQHWRNLHDGEPWSIRIELAEEGAGSTTIGVDWAAGAELAERNVWVQRSRQSREPGIESLGWTRALDLYQPILSYEELGGLLEAGPSKLFDKLDAILGLDQATDTERRLAEALKRLQEDDKAAKAEQRTVKAALSESDDERAAEAFALLNKRPPALDDLAAIAVGRKNTPIGDLARLQALAGLRAPDRAEVAAVTEAVRKADRKLADHAIGSVDAAARRAQLLRDTLAFHDHAGDGPCPVCGVGTLDSAWRQQVERELESEDAELIVFQKARAERDRAVEQARALAREVPAPLRAGQFALEAFDTARTAWELWSQAPDDSAIADHLDATYEDLAEGFAALSREAKETLTAHEDRWAPLAQRLAAWVGLARRAREQEASVGMVKSAHEFMKKCVTDLRNEHGERITNIARDIWAALKQESNVDLDGIEFKGTNTRRRLELRANVDGADATGGALGVMSQGELQALGLALFLPRATMDGSPFRFVVLDDPVQAMDPAKVDGFADVLAKIAEHRQVIVFSHDDRLPQVVRQMGLDARILEVTRKANSSVRVDACSDPAQRYLDDAHAVAKDCEVPDDVKKRVIGGMARMAVEAAARDTYMARRFIAGDHRTDVEDRWAQTRSTSQRVALTLSGAGSNDVSSWWTAKPWRRSTRYLVRDAVHQGTSGDAIDLVRDVWRTVDDIRSGRR